MKRPKTLAVLIVTLFIVMVWANSRAALRTQISGSQSVTIVQAGNPVNVVSNRLAVDGSGVNQPITAASLPLPTGASTEATLALIKSKTDNLDVLLSTRTKPADAQLVTGTVATTLPTGCGNTNYDSGIITMPTSTTVLTSTATCINAIILINLTTSQQTCTITDGQGTPANLIPPSFDLLPKSSYPWVLYGTKALGGIKWSCTNATSVAGIVRGVQ